MSDYKLIIRAESATKVRKWIAERGGVAEWRSLDISDPEFCMLTPADAPRPHWKVGSSPAQVVTDEADILVCVDREVKRFRVGLRMGANGVSVKCTDASSARIRREVERAGEGAYHVFDYWTQEAVIMAPTSEVCLKQWREVSDAVA